MTHKFIYTRDGSVILNLSVHHFIYTVLFYIYHFIILFYYTIYVHCVNFIGLINQIHLFIHYNQYFLVRVQFLQLYAIFAAPIGVL